MRRRIDEATMEATLGSGSRELAGWLWAGQLCTTTDRIEVSGRHSLSDLFSGGVDLPAASRRLDGRRAIPPEAPRDLGPTGGCA